MIKNLLLTLIVITGTLLNSCAKKSTEPEPEKAIGRWTYPTPAISFYGIKAMIIAIVISPDSSFTLDLSEETPPKTLYHSSGTVSSTKDSIYLHNEECTIIDTTPNPDTLAFLDDETCAVPIPLPHPQSADVWTIQTTSMKGLLRAFPIDEAMLDGFLAMMPVLDFELDESAED